jgi:hypothetical protein
MKARLLLVLVATVAAAILPVAGQGSGDHRVYVPVGCAKIRLVYKPRAMCIGNGGSFRRLTWDTYGGKQAVAHGQTFHNNCVPTCAEGTGSWVATRVTVWRVRWACGRRVYTRLGPSRYPFRLWVPGVDHCPR